MAITCKTLLRAKFFCPIKLMAGRGGLNREVSWPYVGQTASVADWVHGGELLFITGVIHEASMLPALLDECISKELAGLVVLTGGEFFKDIPEEVLQKADEAGFPVFSMPWNIKLIDMTRDIIGLIMEDKRQDRNIQNYISFLFFSDEESGEVLSNRATIDGITIANYSFVALFRFASSKCDYGTEKLRQKLLRYCERYCIKCLTDVYGEMVVLLAGGDTFSAAKMVMERLEKFQTKFNDETQKIVLLTFSNVYSDIRLVRGCFREARYTMNIMRNLPRRRCMYFDNLGIYRLLVQINDNKEMESFYRSKLGPILDEDKDMSRDNLLHTLKAYFLAQNSVAQTSKNLCMHRNTVMYRLNKIQRLLKVDLNNANVCLELFMAITIKEFLDSELKDE